MNDIAGAIDAEELKSVMTKLMMVPEAGEIEAMIAAVGNDDDQTVDFEEFDLKMMERTAEVPQTSTVQQPVQLPQVTTQTVARPHPAPQLQTVDVPMPQVMTHEVFKKAPVTVMTRWCACANSRGQTAERVVENAQFLCLWR